MHQMSYYYLILRYPQYRKEMTDMYLTSQYDRLLDRLLITDAIFGVQPNA